MKNILIIGLIFTLVISGCVYLFTSRGGTTYVTEDQSSAYVSAYLNAAANTTVTTAGTYYPIAGTFTNTFANFIFDTDHIEYTGLKTQKFLIFCFASVSTDDGLRTVQVTVLHNVMTHSDEAIGQYCKTADERYTVSGVICATVAKGDEIQLIATSSTSGDVVTFHEFITVMFPI